MGKPPKRKRTARRNLKNARQKLVESVAARELESASDEGGSAEPLETGGPVFSHAVVAENTEQENLAHGSASCDDYDIVDPSGWRVNEHPKQTAQGASNVDEHEAHSAADIGGSGGHIDNDNLGFDEAQGDMQHTEDTLDNGPLVEEDSGSESSEYEIKIDTRPISETEATQLVTAIEQAQAAAEAAYRQDKEAKRHCYIQDLLYGRDA
ncbi:hypothetical protein FRC11_014841, partial [Ceratobasidium sp. 423]